MRRIILLVIFFLGAPQLFAQTEGISYQAVIISPDKQELPGQDVSGNILPNAAIAIRFSIINSANDIIYQEVQKTRTDQFGRINLLIGSADPDNFTQIDWDGTAKDLKVEIDFKGGSNFVDMSRDVLTFIPYAYHRNITARGTLIVNGKSDLNGELTVQGPTNLNSTLNVNNQNATHLSGSLMVDGKTFLNGGLTAHGITTLDTLNILGDMSVQGASLFVGPAEFKAPTEFSDLIVHGKTDMQGQVKIDANMDSVGGDTNYDAYPLLIQGSKQGIAIKVNGERSMDNNYISFWDSATDQMWGRIEGISESELESSDAYQQGRQSKNWAIASESYNTAKAGWEMGLAISELVAASTSSTVCAGLGACVTAPVPSLIVVKGIALGLKIADLVLTGINLGKAISARVNYDEFMKENIGVTYSSGSGDYAEWLPKQNVLEAFSPGDLVGVKNGRVSKNVWAAEKIMIVSTRPIVLGNMPALGNEKDNVKIAFMGQVPVRVSGAVMPGDYILPDMLGSGFAKAVHPSDMKIKDYKKVAGVAWNILDKITDGISLVNVAVGINTNDLSEIIDQQQEKISKLQDNYEHLKDQVEKSNMVLVDLVPGYAEAAGITPDKKVSPPVEKENITSIQKKNEPVLYSSGSDIIYFEVTEEQIDTMLVLAKQQYQQMYIESIQTNNTLLKSTGRGNSSVVAPTLVPVEDHPFWNRLATDAAYKQEIVRVIKEKLEMSFHTHKKYADNFSQLKVKKVQPN